MTNTNIDQSDAIMVPVKVLEKAFGIKERRVRQLAQEGILIKSGHGRYKLIDSVLNYITYLKANVEIRNPDKDESKIDYDEEHAHHERAKRIKAELELKVMSGQLHEADVVEKVMTDMLANFRSRILAMPSKIAPMVQIESKLSSVQTIIRDACMEALYELSNYDPVNFYSDKHVEVIDSEGENDEFTDTTEDTETI